MTERTTIVPARTYGRGNARPVVEMRAQLDEWRRGETSTAGRSVTIRTGGLALLGADSAFVNTGSVTFFGWAGFDVSVDVEVVAEPQPHAVIAAIRVQHRDDGRPIAARSLQAARLGEAMRAAVMELTTAENPTQHVVSALRPGRAGRRSTIDQEIETTARLYRDAMAAGIPTRSAVQAGLAELRGQTARDVRDAGERIRQARRRGLIPPTGGTTRPRLSENEGTS